MLSGNINSNEVSNTGNREAFIEHIKREGVRLTSLYGLSPIGSGSPKQVAFAEDVRTKFLIDFEKRSLSLSDADRESISREWLSHLDARFWLDNKDRAKQFFKGNGGAVFVQSAIPVSAPAPVQMAAPVQAAAPASLPGFSFVVFDCSDGEILRVSFSAGCDVSEILKQFKFTPLNPFEWVYMLSSDSVNRPRLIEDVTREIIHKGFPFKQIPFAPPEKPHDGYLRMVDGKLCIDCMSTAVFRAFSHIGYQRVFLDKADKEQIKDLLKQYDVSVSADVSGFGGEK